MLWVRTPVPLPTLKIEKCTVKICSNSSPGRNSLTTSKGVNSNISVVIFLFGIWKTTCFHSQTRLAAQVEITGKFFGVLGASVEAAFITGSRVPVNGKKASVGSVQNWVGSSTWCPPISPWTHRVGRRETGGQGPGAS